MEKKTKCEHKIVPIWDWVYNKDFTKIVEGKYYFNYCEKCGEIFYGKVNKKN